MTHPKFPSGLSSVVPWNSSTFPRSCFGVGGLGFGVQHLLRRKVKRFREGLVFKAHRRLYRPTLGSRVIKKKKSALEQLHAPEILLCDFGFEICVLCFVFWVLGFGLWVCDMGFGVWDVGCGVWVLEFGVWVLGIGV